ncbi:hypothetical protein [Nitrosomonas sp.]|nr:hypothetical protein [Nitrosomonas sp.]MBY0484125.1 hypothetical protein [Nitrosomonas sp.]
MVIGQMQPHAARFSDVVHFLQVLAGAGEIMFGIAGVTIRRGTSKQAAR